jgi:putative ubiquitin-RnfH superfamily antitoxin RatB of RatAB toxin-antitoxin module
VSGTLRIEVAYAERDRQTLVALEVACGTTAAEAVALAGLAAAHGALVTDPVIGIWGRTVPSSTVLVAGDRVELYRPVPVDPKETRRALARQGRTMGRPRG